MKKIKKNYEKCLPEANASFDFVVRATEHHLFTGTIPLLLSAGTFACCVSALGRYVPHYRTWCSNNS